MVTGFTEEGKVEFTPSFPAVLAQVSAWNAACDAALLTGTAFAEGVATDAHCTLRGRVSCSGSRPKYRSAARCGAAHPFPHGPHPHAREVWPCALRGPLLADQVQLPREGAGSFCALSGMATGSWTARETGCRQACCWDAALLARSFLMAPSTSPCMRCAATRVP